MNSCFLVNIPNNSTEYILFQAARWTGVTDGSLFGCFK